MYLTTMPAEQAIGHILRHNLTDERGHKALPKGRRLRAEDLATMRALGVEQVRVAVLEPGDLHEDEAAARLASAVSGGGVSVGRATHSRVNLHAAADGVVRVDVGALLAINRVEGLTVATLASHQLARARQRIATIKIIPFAVPEQAMRAAEAICAERGVIRVDPLRAARVGVLLVGGAAARRRIEQGVYPAIAGRVEELGSQVAATRYAAPDERAIADAIGELLAAGADLLISAGETSIMDRDDLIPQGVRLAGGSIAHYGAPVEPGNLLLLAYIGDLPVLGAPGCVRSRDANIVDLLLPRLLAGERLGSEQIIALGHGGLLS